MANCDARAVGFTFDYSLVAPKKPAATRTLFLRCSSSISCGGQGKRRIDSCDPQVPSKSLMPDISLVDTIADLSRHHLKRNVTFCARNGVNPIDARQVSFSHKPSPATASQAQGRVVACTGSLNQSSLKVGHSARPGRLPRLSRLFRTLGLYRQ